MNKKQSRAKKVARQLEIVNTAKAENRPLTADEQREFDGLQTEIDQLAREIEEEERSAEGSNQQRQMSAAPAPAVQSAPAAGADDGQRQVLEAERSRVNEIMALCRDFEVDATPHIASGASVDQVRAAILENLRQSHAPLSTGVRVTESGEDSFRNDVSDGMLLRSGLNVPNPNREVQGFANMTMRDLAIECLERSGVSGARRLSPDELFQRQFYNPTSAFPAILDNAINKAYVEGHRTAAVTFDRWTRRGSLRDFKTHDNNYLAGPVGDFLLVPEGGELKADKPTDAKLPTRKLHTYGKQFSLTREAFINDDIDLVTRIPARHAAAARRTINTQCYKILMENPAIYDGVALFHASHGNLMPTGTGVTRAAVQAMMMALSTQKDEFDQPIIIRASAIIVPAGYAFDIYTLFNSPTIQTTDNTQAVNPLYRYRDQIEIIEDPTINALAGGFGNVMPWWLTGAREDTNFIEVDYLNGQEIPTIRRMETPGQLGFVWDIYLDWGINVMDYRGAIKNPGVQVTSPLT